MLPDLLRERIKAKYEELQSLRKVGELYGVSHITVRNIVNGLYKDKPERRGPKPKTTRRQETRIRRAVTKLGADGSRVTAKKVQDHCELGHLSTRTIQRRLRSMDFEFKEASRRIVLSKAHKKSDCNWRPVGSSLNRIGAKSFLLMKSASIQMALIHGSLGSE